MLKKPANKVVAKSTLYTVANEILYYYYYAKQRHNGPTTFTGVWLKIMQEHHDGQLAGYFLVQTYNEMGGGAK